MKYNVNTVFLYQDTKELRDYIEGSSDTLTIPDGTTRINSYAFYYNMNIKNIIIPISVTKIGSKILRTGISYTITYLGTVSEWKAINKNIGWSNLKSGIVQCTNGTVSYM